MSQSITNPRIIKGLLTQLIQLRQNIVLDDFGIAQLMALGDSDPEVAPYTLELSVQDSLPTSVMASFWIEGDYFTCVLKQHSKGVFLPPTEINSVNRREKTRLEMQDIVDAPVSAVLSVEAEKVFCQVQNMDSKNIAIAVERSLRMPVLESHGYLTTYCKGVLTGHHPVLVKKIRNSNGSDTSVLLEITTSSVQGSRTKIRGHEIAPVVLQLNWPDIDGISVLVELNELTGLGLSGAFANPAGEMFPAGTIFYERASGARVRLAWTANGGAGFSFDTSDSKLREQLYHFLNSSNRQANWRSKHSQARGALSLLTKSGLLKAERAISYGNDNKRDIFLHRSAASNRWLAQQSQEDSYLSFVRVSDDSWLIQELGSTNETKGTGATLILSGIEHFQISRHEELSPRSAIIGIFDVSSKFNLGFWHGTLLEHLSGSPQYCRVTLGSIKNKARSFHSSGKIRKATVEEWRESFPKIKDEATRDFLTAFGVSETDFASRLLSDTLLSDSKKLDREVYVVTSKSGSTLGFAVKLGLPPLSNVTSLAENLYLIPATDDHSALIEVVLSADSPALVGIEDICLLKSCPEDDALLQKVISGFSPREFELVLIWTHSFRSAK